MKTKGDGTLTGYLAVRERQTDARNGDTIDEEYRQLMNLAGDEGCKCGIEACPGHEEVAGKIFIENHPFGSIIVEIQSCKGSFARFW